MRSTCVSKWAECARWRAHHQPGQARCCPGPEAAEALFREEAVRAMEGVPVLRACFQGLHSRLDDAEVQTGHTKRYSMRRNT